MKECVTPAVSAPTRQLLNLILGNVNSQFMKECGILMFKHYDPDCKERVLHLSVFIQSTSPCNFPMDTPVPENTQNDEKTPKFADFDEKR